MSRPNNRTVDLSIAPLDAMNARLNVECTRQTNDGPYYDQGCIFPFVYEGEVYNDCTTVGDDRAWCSVEVNEKNEHSYGSCFLLPAEPVSCSFSLPTSRFDLSLLCTGRWGYCSPKTCDTDDGSLYGGSSFVKLSWSGVDDPTARDWIAAYCPSTNDSSDYIDWFAIGDTQTSRGRNVPGWESGSGSTTFRCDLIKEGCKMPSSRPPAATILTD